MQRLRKYEASTMEYFCDKCGEQIHDHRCTCEECYSDFCENCRDTFKSSSACEFCPPELQTLQTELDVVWEQANRDAAAIWKRQTAVREKLRDQQRLTAAERGIHDISADDEEVKDACG